MSGWVYVLKARKKKSHRTVYYVGSTTRSDVRKRLKEHESGDGGEYSRGLENRRIVLLIKILNRNFARAAEYHLKKRRYVIDHIIGIEDHVVGYKNWVKWMKEHKIKYEIRENWVNQNGKKITDF